MAFKLFEVGRILLQIGVSVEKLVKCAVVDYQEALIVHLLKKHGDTFDHFVCALAGLHNSGQEGLEHTSGC